MGGFTSATPFYVKFLSLPELGGPSLNRAAARYSGAAPCGPTHFVMCHARFRGHRPRRSSKKLGEPHPRRTWGLSGVPRAPLLSFGGAQASPLRRLTGYYYLYLVVALAIDGPCSTR